MTRLEGARTIKVKEREKRRDTDRLFNAIIALDGLKVCRVSARERDIERSDLMGRYGFRLRGRMIIVERCSKIVRR